MLPVYFSTEYAVICPYLVLLQHGKEAAQMHRWTELKEQRDATLREIELEDILKYGIVLEALEIPPVYCPTFRVSGK